MDWTIASSWVITFRQLVNDGYGRRKAQHIYMPFWNDRIAYIGLTRIGVYNRILSHVKDATLLGDILPLKVSGRRLALASRHMELDKTTTLVSRPDEWRIKVNLVVGDLESCEKHLINLYQPVFNKKGCKSPGLYLNGDDRSGEGPWDYLDYEVCR